jgi:hypothetical protein
LVQASDDVVVGQLGELGVELPDAIEVGRCVEADQLVGVGADPRLPARRCDRDGEYDARSALGPGDLARSPRAGSGGDAVVDYHCDPPG